MVASGVQPWWSFGRDAIIHRQTARSAAVKALLDSARPPRGLAWGAIPGDCPELACAPRRIPDGSPSPSRSRGAGVSISLSACRLLSHTIFYQILSPTWHLTLTFPRRVSVPTRLSVWLNKTSAESHFICTSTAVTGNLQKLDHHSFLVVSPLTPSGYL